ncbi:unnamed protein product, partial [Rotaria magnacalcarata]
MTEPNPASSVNDDIPSTNETEQTETTEIKNNEPNHEVVTTASTETSTNENVPEEIKPEEKTEILDSSPNTKELE